MLNGIAPIIIFNFSKNIESQLIAANIPIVSSAISKFTLPPIPIYLDERMTGLCIESEDKNIDIETTPETLSSGGTPTATQKGINSTVKINLIANKDSIGLTLIGAMCDLIFKKVTSKEYTITYLHGAVTVFGGLLKSFSINQQANTDLYTVGIELVSGLDNKQAQIQVPNGADTLKLQPIRSSSIPTGNVA